MQDSHSIAEISSLPKSWEELTAEVKQQGHFNFEFSAFGRAFTDAFTIRNLEKHIGCKLLLSQEELIQTVESFGYFYLPPDELMELADGYKDPNVWGSSWYHQIFYYS